MSSFRIFTKRTLIKQQIQCYWYVGMRWGRCGWRLRLYQICIWKEKYVLFVVMWREPIYFCRCNFQSKVQYSRSGLYKAPQIQILLSNPAPWDKANISLVFLITFVLVYWPPVMFEWIPFHPCNFVFDH